MVVTQVRGGVLFVFELAKGAIATRAGLEFVAGGGRTVFRLLLDLWRGLGSRLFGLARSGKAAVDLAHE